MKIVYAIVSSDDGNRVTDVLNENSFSVTKLATTGGFLKKGNSTLMIGTNDDKVEEVINLIKDTCGKRQKSFLLLKDYFRERYHGTAAIELFT